MISQSLRARRGLSRRSVLAIAATALVAGLATSASAGPVVPFETSVSSRYLLIGMGPNNSSGGQPGVGNAVNVSNFELGAMKAPTPSTSGFLTGGSSGGPGLAGNVPDVPLNAKPLVSGIGGRGNVAITHVQGRYNLQNVGVYGDLGVHTAGARNVANAGAQNNFYNDPNHFPNTFNSTGLSNPGVNNNTGGFGTFVGPGQAVQSTRMDAGNYAGVTGNVNLSSLTAEIASMRTAINALATTQTLNVPGGTISSNRTITVGSGLTVINVNTGGNDFKLQNMNLVIDGPADASVIFRLPGYGGGPGARNMLVSNANILMGTGGIENGSVIFYTDAQNNGQHFNVSNSIISGALFWTLGLAGGEINIDNAQGCTQLIADKITLNDVRFNNCGGAFLTVIPLPAAGSLAAVGIFTMMTRRRRPLA